LFVLKLVGLKVVQFSFSDSRETTPPPRGILGGCLLLCSGYSGVVSAKYSYQMGYA
jgi:hypothetical protein